MALVNLEGVESFDTGFWAGTTLASVLTLESIVTGVRVRVGLTAVAAGE